jgi:hypothetical protein
MHISYKFELLPTKMGSNFHGSEVRVATKLTRDSVESTVHNSINSTNISEYDGRDIRLTKCVTSAMNVTTVLLLEVENFLIIQDESGNYVGYTSLLTNGNADMVLGAILRTSTSPTLMNVSKRYYQLTWEWYSPDGKVPLEFYLRQSG